MLIALLVILFLLAFAPSAMCLALFYLPLAFILALIKPYR